MNASDALAIGLQHLRADADSPYAQPLALVAAIIILAGIIYAVLYGCLCLAGRCDDQDLDP